MKYLLEAGHKVRGTVRDAKSNKNDFLKKIEGADKRLELFSADLTVPDAYDEVVVGADYVLHIASPYVLDYKDAEKELIKPAVDGTLSVLKSVVKKNPTCKRIVLTSSFAAVCDAPDHGKVPEYRANFDRRLPVLCCFSMELIVLRIARQRGLCCCFCVGLCVL